MNISNKKRGFTLIELLVVIAIIGVLSSVVLASLNSARQKSRDAKRISDIKQLQLALELYFDSSSPSSYVVVGTVGDADAVLGALVSGGFIAAIPTDPIGTNEYQYIGTATSYCVGAALEGGSNTLDTCGGAAPDITTSGYNYVIGP